MLCVCGGGGEGGRKRCVLCVEEVRICGVFAVHM